jgi:hypothetical protein
MRGRYSSVWCGFWSNFGSFATGKNSHIRRDRKRIYATSQEVTQDPLESVDHLQELSPSRHVLVVPDFLPNSSELRETFDENFRDNYQVKDTRFCWDYWHVPGQYTQLRTPAQAYFNEMDYKTLEASLLDYGKEKLGCLGITPIWLSYYISAHLSHQPLSRSTSYRQIPSTTEEQLVPFLSRAREINYWLVNF